MGCRIVEEALSLERKFEMLEGEVPEINVDEVMAQIRAQVTTRNSGPIHSTSSQSANVEFDGILNSLDEAQQHLYVGSALPPMTRMHGLKRAGARFIGKIVLRVSLLVTRDQRIVNQKLAESIRQIVSALQKIVDNLERIDEEVFTRKDMDEWVGKLQEEMGLLSTQLAKETEQNLQLRHIVEQINQRVTGYGDELSGRFERDRKEIDALTNSIASQTTEIDAIKRIALQRLRTQILLQERRLSLLLEEARRRMPESFDIDQLQTFSDGLSSRNDQLYITFEDQFRGDREEIKDRLRFYLPFIAQARAGLQDRPIVDLGSGRGEWLEILRSENLSAKGVDTNRVMVEQAQGIGLDTVFNDAISFLEGLPDSSVGGITGFHIVEHLAFDKLQRLLEESLRVLKSGGIIILETPNPKNLIVGACNFYADPTHRNPVHPDTLKFLAEIKGFTRVEIAYWAKADCEDGPTDGLDTEPMESGEFRRIKGIVDEWFNAPPDYAVVGWRV